MPNHLIAAVPIHGHVAPLLPIAAHLVARGDTVTVLSRDPDRARADLGVETAAWDPLTEPAPAAALSGRDAVVHLAGAPVAQRWSDSVKKEIHDSREIGTRNLVAGLRAASPAPGWLAARNAACDDAGKKSVLNPARPPAATTHRPGPPCSSIMGSLPRDRRLPASRSSR